MKNSQRTRLTLVVCLLALSSLGCGGVGLDPVAPDTAVPSFSRNAGTSAGFADVVLGDFVLTQTDAPALLSTCPGAASSPGWSVVFGKTLCLIVKPSGKYENYQLIDDIVLAVTLEKGKNGRITHVRLNGQDVDGPAGLWHNTDLIAVAQPIVPGKAGFTLHVHAKNVEVWRFDSHLAGGNRVEMVGTISIGDVVYRPQ